MARNWITGILISVAVAAIAIAVVTRGSTAGNAGHSAETAAAEGGSQAQGKQLYTCGMHPQVIQDHPGNCPICHMKLTPMRTDASDGNASAEGKNYAQEAGPAVRIDPAVVQNMGVRTAEVTRGPLTRTVRTVGMLKLPEPGMHDVSLKVGGWIDKLYADQEGMHVKVGEPLFALYSQDLQVAEQELISAVKARAALAPGAAEEVRKEADALVNSSKQKLRLWDVADQDIEAIAAATEPPRDVVFRSPASGHVEDKAIVQGTAVQPGMKLMRVADHATMWLDAQVYEEQIPFVRPGQTVEASVEGNPGRTFTGTITFVYPHVDHMSRTLTVRATLDNPGFALRPGMYATVDIATRPLPDAVQVPREAVIDTGTRQIAFVDTGDGHFDPRKVRMGLSGDNGMVQIVEGLAPGERVVTSGQFLMDVESRTTEAIEKLRGK